MFLDEIVLRSAATGCIHISKEMVPRHLTKKNGTDGAVASKKDLRTALDSV